MWSSACAGLALRRRNKWTPFFITHKWPPAPVAAAAFAVFGPIFDIMCFLLMVFFLVLSRSCADLTIRSLLATRDRPPASAGCATSLVVFRRLFDIIMRFFSCCSTCSCTRWVRAVALVAAVIMSSPKPVPLCIYFTYRGKHARR